MCCSMLWHCFASSLSSLPLHGPSARRWRWLSSRFSRLMFPLHQQNIWESKHKAGEARWELQPESPSRCRAQVESKGCSEQAGAVAPPAPWVLGAWESSAGWWGSVCAGWSSPQKTAWGGKPGKPAQHRNLPATGAGMGAEMCAVEEDLRGTGNATAPRSTSPQLKGDHLVAPGGQAEPGTELPPLRPLCSRCSFWSQRDALSSPGVLCCPWCDGWCSGQAARLGWGGSGCAQTLCCG